jgi:hypothetical protein
MHPTHQPATGPRSEPTPADILRGAALYLERHGWTRFVYFDGTRPTPAACAQGAIVIAAYGQATDSPYNMNVPERRLFAHTIDFFDDYLRGTTDPEDDDYNATVWNDNPTRTVAEVIAGLRAAAEAWEHSHGGVR